MTPTNETAERAVLSVMLTYETCATRALAELSASDFFSSKNREIFVTMHRLIKEGKTINMVTVASVYDDITYLTGFGTEFSSPSQLESYIDALRETRQRRELITACNTIKAAAESNEEGLMETAKRAIADVGAIGGGAIEPVGKAALDAVTSISGGQIGTRTGFNDLDILLRGLQPGQLVIVAARPAMGKSAFCTNVAVNIAKAGGVVAVFSVEMGETEVLQRAGYYMSGCSSCDVLRQDEIQIQRLVDAALEISRMQLFIDDRSNLTAEDVRARCYRIKQRTERLDLVVVDYLQLMQVQTSKNRTREQEVAAITRSMKLMAREMGCPVLLLSQLSRGLENRADKIPRMSDLRDSGAIEQDADVIIFLHRPFNYGDSKDEGEALAVVAKNRNGATGDIALRWTGEYFRFTSRCWTSETRTAANV